MLAKYTGGWPRTGAFLAPCLVASRGDHLAAGPEKRLELARGDHVRPLGKRLLRGDALDELLAALGEFLAAALLVLRLLALLRRAARRRLALHGKADGMLV